MAAPPAASGTTAGCDCGKPAVESRRRCGWRSARGARSLRRMHLLIAGGGPAALEGALAVQRLAGERVTITLLSDRDEFVYRPVAVAEPFGLAIAAALLAAAVRRRPRLRRCGSAGSRAVDPGAHRVRTDAERARLRRAPARARRACRGGGPRRADVPRPGGQRAAARRARAPARRRAAARRVRGRAGDRVDAAAVRAGADDRPLGGRARAGARAVGRDLGAPAADDLRRGRRERGRRVCSPRPACACGRARSPRPSRTAGCGSASRAGCRSTSPSRCRARRTATSQGCPPTPTASSRSTSTAACRALPDVYAAGDMTSRPLKQGGLATQQADAAAAAIAAAAGRRRRGRGVPAGAARDAAHRRTVRATCATLRGDHGMPATTRPGGRRTRSPAASSRPT